MKLIDWLKLDPRLYSAPSLLNGLEINKPPLGKNNNDNDNNNDHDNDNDNNNNNNNNRNDDDQDNDNEWWASYTSNGSLEFYTIILSKMWGPKKKNFSSGLSSSLLISGHRTF